METKGFFEITMIVLVSFFRFIRIPILWVYGNYIYFYSFSASIVFIQSESDVCRRHILTYVDGPRTEGVKMSSFNHTAIFSSFEEDTCIRTVMSNSNQRKR